VVQASIVALLFETGARTFGRKALLTGGRGRCSGDPSLVAAQRCGESPLNRSTDLAGSQPDCESRKKRCATHRPSRRFSAAAVTFTLIVGQAG
jgi:hypothetical protein